MSGFEVVYEAPASYTGYAPITHLYGTRQLVSSFSIKYIKDTIGEISGLQTFLDLSEADSDLVYMILKGTDAELDRTRQIPENDISTADCGFLHNWSQRPEGELNGLVIDGQEHTCTLTFPLSTITKFMF